MIDPRYYGLLELVLVMAAVLGFAIWQLRELKQLEKAHRDAETRDADRTDGDGRD